MKIFAYRPEILCTTSWYCFRSGVNLGTTCKRHMWKRAEHIAQNQREQGTARAVWFSQVTLSKRFPTSCCLSPKAGVHSVVLPHQRPHLLPLWPTPGAPDQSLLCAPEPWEPWWGAGPELLGHSSHWSHLPAEHCTSNPWPNPRHFLSYSPGCGNVQTTTKSAMKFLQLAFYLLLVQMKAEFKGSRWAEEVHTEEQVSITKLWHFFPSGQWLKKSLMKDRKFTTKSQKFALPHGRCNFLLPEQPS